jgi:hypothetical protein
MRDWLWGDLCARPNAESKCGATRSKSNPRHATLNRSTPRILSLPHCLSLNLTFSFITAVCKCNTYAGLRVAFKLVSFTERFSHPSPPRVPWVWLISTFIWAPSLPRSFPSLIRVTTRSCWVGVFRTSRYNDGLVEWTFQLLVRFFLRPSGCLFFPNFLGLATDIINLLLYIQSLKLLGEW